MTVEFLQTRLYRKLETTTSFSRSLQTGEKKVSYFLIGDEASHLSDNLLKVYPGNI